MAKHSDPGFLHRPPKINPFVPVVLGIIGILIGLFIDGLIGRGIVGGGIAGVLVGLWDIFRIAMGLVHKPPEKSPEASSQGESTH